MESLCGMQASRDSQNNQTKSNHPSLFSATSSCRDHKSQECDKLEIHPSCFLRLRPSARRDDFLRHVSIAALTALSVSHGSSTSIHAALEATSQHGNSGPTPYLWLAGNEGRDPLQWPLKSAHTNLPIPCKTQAGPMILMRAPGVVERVLLVEALYSEDPLFSE